MADNNKELILRPRNLENRDYYLRSNAAIPSTCTCSSSSRKWGAAEMLLIWFGILAIISIFCALIRRANTNDDDYYYYYPQKQKEYKIVFEVRYNKQNMPIVDEAL